MEAPLHLNIIQRIYQFNIFPHKNLRLTFWSIIYLFASSNNLLAGEQQPWITWQQNKQLTIKYRPSPYKDLLEVSAKTTVKSSLSAFLYFIADTDNIPQWLDNAASARIIEQIGINENIFITQFSGFWPVKNREMIIHSRIWQNEDLSIEIKVTDATNALKKTPNTIRMRVFSAHWKIIPIDPSNILISYTATVDPQGNLPLWLIKSMTLKGMKNTLENIAEQLPKSKWQHYYWPKIKELSTNKQ